MKSLYPEQINIFGEGESLQPKASGVLAEKFLVPPFSVLDARAGYWQERKRAWLGLGIRGEVGRDGNLLQYSERASLGEKDTSIFDPVICELAYKWFCPEGGQVVDPFAGGSVRGIIASGLGCKYYGIELRPEQVEANYQQIDLCEEPLPVWLTGDSMQELENAPDADFIFSCPPYGDLEVYSDDPRDLSNMEYHTFLPAYKRIILRAVKKLKQDRFACFVVGDFRDKKGFYRNFVSETISAFEQCGVHLYNEGILVTAVGSASMRASRIFSAGRKLVKTHQNVLVFCKGDWRKATEALGGDSNSM